MSPLRIATDRYAAAKRRLGALNRIASRCPSRDGMPHLARRYAMADLNRARAALSRLMIEAHMTLAGGA